MAYTKTVRLPMITHVGNDKVIPRSSLPRTWRWVKVDSGLLTYRFYYWYLLKSRNTIFMFQNKRTLKSINTTVASKLNAEVAI